MSSQGYYSQAMPGAGARNGVLQEDDDLSPHTMAATGAADDAAGPRFAGSRSMTEATSDALLAAVLASLDDDKAEDVVQIDLRGKSEMGDWMVVCSGRSSRQVAAIAEKLTDRLKQDFGVISKVEGKETGDWVLIDTGDIIVHVFRPEVREFYQLEKMWMPATDAAAKFR